LLLARYGWVMVARSRRKREGDAVIGYVEDGDWNLAGGGGP
jgi:hypothetical protein